MAEETATIEAPAGEEVREFGTPLSAIFEKKLGTGDEIPIEPEEKTEPAKVEPKKEAAKAPAKEESVRSLPETLFGDITVPKKEETKLGVEPIKEEAPAELKGKARENFERLATAKHEAEKTAFAAQKRIKELEAKAEEGDPGAKAKIQQLETQLKEYSERVSVADVRLHPEFQRQFTVPRQQALEYAQKAYADYGGDPKILEQALSLTGKARIEKLDEIYGEIQSKTVLGKLERAVEFVENKDAEIENALKNSGELAKQLKQQDQIKQSEFLAQHEEKTKKDLEEAGKLLADQFNMAIFKRTDDPNFKWWNDEIDKMGLEAQNLMLKTPDPKELAIASYLAVSAPRLHKLFIEEHKARLAIEKQFKDYKAGEPGLGGNDKVEAAVEEDEEAPLKSSILKSIKAAQAQG